MTLLQIWEQDIKTVFKAIEQIGGEFDGIFVKPPCSRQTLDQVEKQLGMRLPDSFRLVGTDFTSGIEMSWSLSDDEPTVVLPDELKEVFAGHFSWSLEEVPAVEQSRKRWECEVFPDINNEYDKVWHHKLGFMEVGNGDFIAFDLSIPHDPPVVYLSHDDGGGHGYRLGANFIDFMNRWTKIGCVGCEDWQLLPFMDGPESGILPDSENAVKWRTFLKIPERGNRV